jgi:hypothetical protein
MCLYRCMYMAWSCMQRHVTARWVGCSWQMKYIIGAELLLAHLHTILPHCTTSLLFHAFNGTLCLKWKPHRIESCFPVFITRVDTLKLHQLLSLYSALQLAVEHLPEYTDRWKIKNTTTHIIRTSSGNHTVSHSIGIFSFLGVKRPEHEANQKYSVLCS